MIFSWLECEHSSLLLRTTNSCSNSTIIITRRRVGNPRWQMHVRWRSPRYFTRGFGACCWIIAERKCRIALQSMWYDFAKCFRTKPLLWVSVASLSLLYSERVNWCGADSGPQKRRDIWTSTKRRATEGIDSVQVQSSFRHSKRSQLETLCQWTSGQETITHVSTNAHLDQRKKRGSNDR